MKQSSLSLWLIRLLVVSVLLAVFWSVGYNLSKTRVVRWNKSPGKIHVLTTIFPLYDMASQIGGGHVQVINLLPPGSDPHEFSLSPHDAELIEGADVIISNGAGLDNYLQKAIQYTGRKNIPICVASSGLKVLIDPAESSGSSAHPDPHLWMDPVNAETYARNITDSIIAAGKRKGMDTSVIDEIKKAEVLYQKKLTDLDQDYRSVLGPLKSREIIVFHPAYQYLANRYGLKVAAVWQEIPGREPDPSQIKNILLIAKQKHIHALFAEPEFSDRAIDIIAEDAHLKVSKLDPAETADNFQKTHYIDLMKTNLAIIAQALK
jgi:ABC-type Zn uptake system ZnuABC Zn-binding protein ZnuA